MKASKKLYRLLSLVLAICMTAAFLPTVSFAAVSYINCYSGSEALSTTLGSSTTAVWTKDAAGFAGKLADDTVYTYFATDAGTGQGYMSLTPSSDASGDAYDADSQVIEFNFLLEDETSQFHFSPAFFNSTGYEYFLKNGKLVNTSGLGYFKSLNSFIQFSANGIKVYDSSDNEYMDSAFQNMYLAKNEAGYTSTAGENPLAVGVWHTVAIKTPGLIGGVGEATYDEEGNVIEGVYAGEDKCYITVDGTEYVIPMVQQLYGTRHIKLHTKNTTHLDNLITYYTKDLEANSDYNDSAAMPKALTSQSTSAAVDGSVITLADSLTVSQLKATLTSSDIIRVYTDDTYTSLADDSDLAKAGNTVVVAAKNGDDTERSYSYYSIEELTYEEDGLKDGTASLSLSSLQDGCSITNNTAGVFGKAADDVVYKADITGTCHTGYNYISGTGDTLDTSVFELSMATTTTTSFALESSLYTASDKSTNVKKSLITISGGKIYAGSDPTLIASSDAKKELGTINAGEWVNIVIVIPGYNTTGTAAKNAYVYINGAEKTIALATDIYGTKHLRFAASGTYTDTQTFYYDNIRAYTAETEAYDAKKDAQPVLDFGAFKVSDGTILTDEGITVGEFKEEITTSAAIRIFEDNTYAKELSDTDELPFGAMVVFAATNRRTTERAYSYYTTGEMTYEEPNLYEGTKDLSLGANADKVKPTVTETGGVYGKDKEDMVYQVTVNGGAYGTGYNFLTLDSGYTLDTTVAEWSMLVTDGTKFNLESSFFTSASATDKIPEIDETTGEEVVDEEGNTVTVSNTSKGVLFTIAEGKIKAGSTSSYFDAESKGKLLGEIKDGEWLNIALVVPGYNSYEETENYNSKTVYVYVNGVENKITLANNIYGVRHLRFSPAGSEGDVKTFYYDNIRKYLGTTESYDPKKDLQPVVDFSGADMLDGNINVTDGTTVADFKDMVSTKAAIRVFENKDYKAQLEDTDEMSGGNIVVFATDNNRTTERTYSYYTVNRSLSVQSIKLVNSDGKIIKGSQSDIDRMGETYYLDTTIENKSVSTNVNLLAIVASYDEDGKMDYCESKQIVAYPGTTTISTTENQVAFEKVTTPEGGTLKAFLWVEKNNEPLCEEFSAIFNGVEEYHILAIGNSYSNNSFIYLPAIGAADGVNIYAVNLYEGGCPIETHYKYMKKTSSGTYDYRYEHTPNGVISTAGVTFEEGFNTYGYTWDFITLHQKGQYSPFYYRYYTEETPYITEFADYIAENSPASEFLLFENWAPYTDRIDEVYDVYEPIVSGLTREEYIPAVFGAIKSCYIQAAEQIGNPGRIIPAGEAIYNAIFKYGFTEYVDNDSTTDTSFKDAAGAMYVDQSSHLTTYGKVLAALTWYEYLTGHDVTQNSYQNSKISEEDMALLKQIAHEVCQVEDYIPAN